MSDPATTIAPVILDLWQYDEAIRKLTVDDINLADCNDKAVLPKEERAKLVRQKVQSEYRIQACLNACYGLDSKMLREGGIGCMRDTIVEMQAQIDKAKGEKKLIITGR